MFVDDGPTTNFNGPGTKPSKGVRSETVLSWAKSMRKKSPFRHFICVHRKLCKSTYEESYETVPLIIGNSQIGLTYKKNNHIFSHKATSCVYFLSLSEAETCDQNTHTRLFLSKIVTCYYICIFSPNIDSNCSNLIVSHLGPH